MLINVEISEFGPTNRSYTRVASKKNMTPEVVWPVRDERQD